MATSSLIRPINVLPADLANKIAAGEVVERPASVVKELVENSIDAGSSAIEIEVRDGGKEYIRVSDNGCGMSPRDINLAFLRHATSKISTAEELALVSTLGFRGEALPSIASCADVEVTSRPAQQESATRLIVKGGVVAPPTSAAGAPGTSIIVRRLFYNAPARYKFLKQSATEKRYIAEYVLHMALAHPQVAFKLITEVGLLLTTPGNCDLLTACAAVHGAEVARRLIPVQCESPFINVSGFVSLPSENRHNRSHESIFVNGRWVKNHILFSAVEKGYEKALPTRRYPVAVLHLSIDPTMLDVNVHPAKTEVRFRHESEIYRHIMLSVRSAIGGAGPLPTLTNVSTRSYTPQPEQVVHSKPAALFAAESRPLKHIATPAYAERSIVQSDKISVELASAESDPFLSDHLRTPLCSSAPPSEVAALQVNLPLLPILGQVLHTYIVLAAPDGLWLVDQHVAHERILYEQALHHSKQRPAQLTLTPTPVQLTAAEAALVESTSAALAETGIILEPFGANSYLVRALPIELTRVPEGTALRELLADVAAAWENEGANIKERLAANIACRAAIKAGRPLSSSSQSTLITALANAENPLFCPHGRPVIIAIDRSELERRFGRR